MDRTADTRNNPVTPPTTGVFFTSDTHFCHARAAESRKFSSTFEHDEALIANWNAVVDNKARVYHLGDFCLGNRKQATDIFYRLNGQKYFVLGNHDDHIETALESLFIWVRHAHYFKVADQKIYLHHYGGRVWRSSHHGSWHLYGHSHGTLKDQFFDNKSLSLDVGVDCWNLAPVSFERIRDEMQKRKWEPVDYHKKRGT